MLAVTLFTRFDRDWQDVLPGRQRARCKCSEGAGRVGGFVEVEVHAVAVGDGGIEKSACAVGGVSAGGVLEHEEEFVVLGDRFQAELFAGYSEFRVSG